MGLQIQLSAQLTAGPSTTTDNLFPSGVDNVSFNLSPPNKAYSVAAGGVVNIASPSPAFQNIPSVGTGGTVTQVHTIYARTGTVGMLLQLTFQNPNGGGNIVITKPIQGVWLEEFPSNGLLLGIAVQGSGQFEFGAWGNQ
jgi:hypothetical protein